MTKSGSKDWKKGYVHVYTGDGKGKTTAAFGLALRAAGAGLKVFIAQFLKGMDYSELESIKRFSPQIVLKQYGRGCFIRNKPSPDDVKAAVKGLEEVKEAVASGRYDLVILDEANMATYFRLFPVEELLALIDGKPDSVELVITGRKADPKVLEKADLITEMREVKHYYARGVQARKGIEN